MRSHAMTPGDLAARFGVGASAIRRRLRGAPAEIRKLNSGRGRWLFEGEAGIKVEEWLAESLSREDGDWLLVTLTGPDPYSPPAAQVLDAALALVELHSTIQKALDPRARGVLLASRIRYGSPVELQFVIDLVIANHEAIATWLSVVMDIANAGIALEALRRSGRGATLPEPRSAADLERAARERGVLEDYYNERTRLELGPLRFDRTRTRRVRRRGRKPKR